MGCGSNKPDGFVHVDSFAGCAPDVVLDLEATPWPWADDSVDGVLFNHSLEHLGATVDKFRAIIQELYRVCRAGALVQIKVPHPRHDDFLVDPTHVRAITPELFLLLSKAANERYRSLGAANTPLAMIWQVDFSVQRVAFGLDERYAAQRASGAISEEQLAVFCRERNNVIKEISIDLLVVK